MAGEWMTVQRDSIRTLPPGAEDGQKGWAGGSHRAARRRLFLQHHDLGIDQTVGNELSQQR